MKASRSWRYHSCVPCKDLLLQPLNLHLTLNAEQLRCESVTQKFSRYFGFFTEKSSYVPTCLLVHCVCAATATDAGADIFVATAKIHILRGSRRRRRCLFVRILT